MRQTYLCLAFILSHVLAIGGDECNVMGRLEEMMRTLAQAVGNSVNSATGKLSQKLDDINKAVENQKLTFEDFKKSLNTRDEEIRELVESMEKTSGRQVQTQKYIRESLKSQVENIAEIKNIISVGFSKVLGKLESVSQINATRIESYGRETEKLAAAHTQQEKTLALLRDTLRQTTESIVNSTKMAETLRKDILAALAEQTKPLSAVAVSHVNKVDTIAKSMSTEMTRFDDLEPKLVHVTRLSEDLQKDQPNNHIVSNLTASLRALKNSAPAIASSVSKNIKELSDALQRLKTLSKDDCPADLTSEIRDHHNKMIKYLNDTIADRSRNQGTNDKAWNDMMRKLEDIASNDGSSGDIKEKLTKLRKDIADMRESLGKYFEEPDNNNIDYVFG